MFFSWIQTSNEVTWSFWNTKRKILPEVEVLGGQNYEEATAYIEEKFEGLNANPEKTIYMHQVG